MSLETDFSLAEALGKNTAKPYQYPWPLETDN